MNEDVDKSEKIHMPDGESVEEDTAADSPEASVDEDVAADAQDRSMDADASTEDPAEDEDLTAESPDDLAIESPETSEDKDPAAESPETSEDEEASASEEAPEASTEEEISTESREASADEAPVPKKKKKRRVSVSTIILVVILLAGVGIFTYPTISDWWNSMHATQAIAGYVAAVEGMSKEEKEAIIQKAHEFNDTLPNGANFNLSPEKYAEYESILDITGTGIMGYIQIGVIGVDLPIYHGTDEAILQIAVGHLAGTSFPVGGDRTHAVMSGHRGLPSAKLFTDLDKLTEGDTFTVTVLDQTVTYAIDQIRIVLPEETDELAIQNGHDYATLVTCTPYGVNSHRMLMRGTRVDNVSSVATPAEAVRIPTYIIIPAVGIPLLFIVLLVMLIYYRLKGKQKTTEEIMKEIRKQ